MRADRRLAAPPSGCLARGIAKISRFPFAAVGGTPTATEEAADRLEAGRYEEPLVGAGS